MPKKKVDKPKKAAPAAKPATKPAAKAKSAATTKKKGSGKK